MIKNISEGESQQACSAIKWLSESITSFILQKFKNIGFATTCLSSMVYQHPVVSSRVRSSPYRQSHCMMRHENDIVYTFKITHLALVVLESKTFQVIMLQLHESEAKGPSSALLLGPSASLLPTCDVITGKVYLI